MNISSLDGLLWLTMMLVALFFLQRKLHHEMQVVLLLLTRSPGATLIIFSLIFFPGVLLHELSHFFFAKLLQLRTGRFSVMPVPMPDGRLQMGFVEIERSDILRGSLVGVAPMIVGTFFVGLVAYQFWSFQLIWDLFRTGKWAVMWTALQTLISLPDFWIWFYLVLVVSATMIPSASDRYAWTPLLAIFAFIFLLLLIGGAGPWMLSSLGPILNGFSRSAALILLVSVLVHLVLLPPFLGLHTLLVRMMGVDAM